MIVIGADAAGMSAASQARRRRSSDDLEIVAFEMGRWVSYSACGEPYYVAGDVDDIHDLVARTPEQFAKRDIDVRIHHEVTAIDTGAGTVTVRSADGDETHGYDILVYATGAAPIVPPIPGIDLAGIHPLHTLDEAQAIAAAVGDAEQAVVVGGGYVGLEVAEAFMERGLTPPVLSLGPGVMERTLDEDMSVIVADQMRHMGFPMYDGHPVDHFEGEDGRVVAVHTTTGERLPADLVVLGMGTRPRSELAAAAGIPLGPTGAVAVDDRQRTQVDGVWAAGDCAEAIHRLTGQPVNYHLGTIANKQGRVAGTNIGGDDATFPGVLGTAITKVCDLEVARTGLTETEATEAGFDAVTAMTRSTTISGYMPGSDRMRIKTVAERGTGRLLGAQIVGGTGAGKRIDTLAAALWTGMAMLDLEYADLAYAPPFSSTWDPVQIAARNTRRAAGG